MLAVAADYPRSLCFWTPDVGAARARLGRAGLEPSEPVDQPWGHRSVEVVDPDGHLLTLFEVRDR